MQPALPATACTRSIISSQTSPVVRVHQDGLCGVTQRLRNGYLALKGIGDVDRLPDHLDIIDVGE